MKERINDKISEIEEYLSFLLERVPQKIEDYKGNLDIKAICERYIEKIIEGVVDLAFIFFKEEIARNNKKIKMPESDTDIFDILKKSEVISESLCEKLKEAKGMRNWIAHEYGNINDNIIYNSLKKELEKDVNNFIASIKSYYLKSEEVKE